MKTKPAYLALFFPLIASCALNINTPQPTIPPHTAEVLTQLPITSPEIIVRLTPTPAPSSTPEMVQAGNLPAAILMFEGYSDNDFFTFTETIRKCDLTRDPQGTFITNKGPAIEGEYFRSVVRDDPESLFVVGRLCGTVTLRDTPKGYIIGAVLWIGAHGGHDVYIIKPIMILYSGKSQYLRVGKTPDNNIDDFDLLDDTQQWYARDTDMIDALKNPANLGMQVLIDVQLEEPGQIPYQPNSDGVALKALLDGGLIFSTTPGGYFINMLPVPSGFQVSTHHAD